MKLNCWQKTIALFLFVKKFMQILLRRLHCFERFPRLVRDIISWKALREEKGGGDIHFCDLIQS